MVPRLSDEFNMEQSARYPILSASDGSYKLQGVCAILSVDNLMEPWTWGLDLPASFAQLQIQGWSLMASCWGLTAVQKVLVGLWR